MHNKIIVLSHARDAKLSEHDVCESGFVPWIGDYCSDYIDDVDKDIVIRDWIRGLKIKYGPLVEANKEKIVFKKGFKAFYTAELVNDLQKCVYKTLPKDLDQYLTPSKLVAPIKEIIEGDGLYIYWEGFFTIGSFFRNAVEEQIYYFGDVLDYHQ